MNQQQPSSEKSRISFLFDSLAPLSLSSPCEWDFCHSWLRASAQLLIEFRRSWRRTWVRFSLSRDIYSRICGSVLISRICLHSSLENVYRSEDMKEDEMSMHRFDMNRYFERTHNGLRSINHSKHLQDWYCSGSAFQSHLSLLLIVL